MSVEYQGIPHTTTPLYVVRADGHAGRVVGWQDAQDNAGRWRAIAIMDGEACAFTVDERYPTWAGATFTDDFYTAFGRVEQVTP